MSVIFSHEKGGTRRKYNAYLYRKIKFRVKKKNNNLNFYSRKYIILKIVRKKNFKADIKETEVFIQCCQERSFHAPPHVNSK
jgi:hypothetical protein